MYCSYAVNIVTVSYQYCYYSYCNEIHLHSYIHLNCPLTYYDSIIFIMLNFKLSWKFDFIKNIESVHLWYFEHNFFAADKSIHCLWFSIINNKCRNQVPVIKPRYHWKTDHYQGSADHCEGGLDFYLNCLASGNIQQYTTVPIQCEWLPWTWLWRLLYFYRWFGF